MSAVSSVFSTPRNRRQSLSTVVALDVDDDDAPLQCRMAGSHCHETNTGRDIQAPASPSILEADQLTDTHRRSKRRRVSSDDDVVVRIGPAPAAMLAITDHSTMDVADANVDAAIEAELCTILQLE